MMGDGSAEHASEETMSPPTIPTILCRSDFKDKRGAIVSVFEAELNALAEAATSDRERAQRAIETLREVAEMIGSLLSKSEISDEVALTMILGLENAKNLDPKIREALPEYTAIIRRLALKSASDTTLERYLRKK
jgi:hypothetical protein